MSFKPSQICLLGALLLWSSVTPVSAQLSLNQNDHIAFIGNALPDRMQHDGWLESYLQCTNPDKQLVIRNLGFSGDQVAYRPRNKNFPNEHEYLTLVRADWIFAFFGYNESYHHNPGQFKKDLSQFIKETRDRRYNGKAAPKIVLFSPIAHENLNSPDVPDGEENNLWLSIYTDAMSRVAESDDVIFVDLYTPSKALFEKAKKPLTINGIHLTADGNKALARVIVEALQGTVGEENIDRVRAAVLAKNWCWFNRYRATDGNDVWGSRAKLKFVNDQTNAEVLQHELIMLDVMTANRDRVIWKANFGQVSVADDSNVPNPVLVESNYAPSVKNGELAYVSPEDALTKFTLAKGMKANLFASEEMFPEFVNPVQMSVDTRGRIWVAVWETYPKWQPDQEMLDRLLILSDENHDGVADGAKTFAFVHNPTGFTFWNGGVIVVSAPNILFLKDTDGDDVADVREILFSGIDSSDTHHTANGLDYGPDGYIYYQRGVFNVSNVETPWQTAQLSGASAMYRFNPRTYRFSLHATNPPNPHGGDFDYWGYQYATDGTGGRAFQVRPDADGRFKMHELLVKTVRPVASSGILSSLHFPPELNGNYMILNCIGFLGIKQYELDRSDGEVWGTETEDLLVSSDGNFRPSDFVFGDDGALYVADWSNPLIGHMQHNVRDPVRDHEHGRIYRITVEGRPLQESVKIDGESIETLLDVLKHPVNGIRLRARIELSERDSQKVVAATQKWIMQFDAMKREDAHHLLEALWIHQQHNVINETLLEVLLNSPEPHARRAAERVRHMWKIEGRLGAGAGMTMDHSTHVMPQRIDLEDDYLKQEKAPEPRMVGDTFEIHIQTLIEQMRYERTQFTVVSGMKVRLIFTNPDAMDHNLIMVQPGAAAEVAMAALMLGAGGVQKQWKPESDKILFASGLLSIGESQTIEFTAPQETGRYDYLCTFPGHWQLMRGVMIVQARHGENIDIAVAAGEQDETSDDDFWADSGTANEQAEAELPPAPVTDQKAQAADGLTVADGFSVELLYTAVREVQGSWVSITKDDRGRLIVSDEGDRGLFQITPARRGDADALTKVEKIDVPLSAAQGLCWMNLALYANVSDEKDGGIWRVKDTNGDGQLNKAERLLALRGAGEHGPHAVVPTENGRGLYFLVGNNTDMPKFDRHRAPPTWGDDRLLARQWDAHGNARAPIAPGDAAGGWVAKYDLERRRTELIATGLRNAYDLAINSQGELFTADVDTEWDMGMPWYRPGRIYHVVSGGEFGWRPGTGSWPPYFEDSVAPVLEVGPGSPRGILFGTGAKFPARYQEALYTLDWRFGSIHAVHLKPQGGTYTATRERLVTGRPLPVSDAVVGDDGAFYFIVGGRGTQSALYRVFYTGTDVTTPVVASRAARRARVQRRKLESYHRAAAPANAITAAWPYLGSDDRSLRFAARVALENQPTKRWRPRALDETDPKVAVIALMALARQGKPEDCASVIEALGRLDFDQSTVPVRLAALRACGLALIRMGEPDEALRRSIIEALDPICPSSDDLINVELARLLVYLEAPSAVEKTMALMADLDGAPMPDWAKRIRRNGRPGSITELYGGTINKMLRKPPPTRKLDYAFILRNAKQGWTMSHRQAYFEFFNEARKRTGGPKYGEFLFAMRAEAISTCTPAVRDQLATFMEVQLLPTPPKSMTPPQGPGRMWTKQSALQAIGPELAGRSFSRGQNLFHATACSLCHQFNGAGGVGGAIGPELSSVASKYSVSDLLDAILTPSKDIPDQYGSVIARTKSGKMVVGRMLEGADAVQVIGQDPAAPPEVLQRKDLDSIHVSSVSQMPQALLHVLNEEELKDLVAYLLSSGDRNAAVFHN